MEVSGSRMKPHPVEDEPIEQAPAAPQPVEVQVGDAATQQLRAFHDAQNRINAEAHAFLVGLCAGLGIDIQRVMSADDERGVLILRPESEEQAT